MPYIKPGQRPVILTAITQEFYRKIIGPYEDTKISENGDVE